MAQIDLGDRELETAVREVLPPGWTEIGTEESLGRFSLRRTQAGGYVVIIGEQPQLDFGTLDVALGFLDAQIRLHVAANATPWIFVHAGVVADGNRAIVLPGQSFAGKTTLVKALIEAGATYFSDEFAVLDSNGRVHPYPKPLSVRSRDGVDVQELDVQDLGGTAAERAAEIAVVAVARYRSGAQWSPHELSRGEGVLALMANAVPAQERPTETLEAVSGAVESALILQGDRGEAGPVAAALLDVLRRGA